jgi:hypothetical protein
MPGIPQLRGKIFTLSIGSEIRKIIMNCEPLQAIIAPKLIWEVSVRIFSYTDVGMVENAGGKVKHVADSQKT